METLSKRLNSPYMKSSKLDMEPQELLGELIDLERQNGASEPFVSFLISYFDKLWSATRVVGGIKGWSFSNRYINDAIASLSSINILTGKKKKLAGLYLILDCPSPESAKLELFVKCKTGEIVGEALSKKGVSVDDVQRYDLFADKFISGEEPEKTPETSDWKELCDGLEGQVSVIHLGGQFVTETVAASLTSTEGGFELAKLHDGTQAIQKANHPSWVTYRPSARETVEAQLLASINLFQQSTKKHGSVIDETLLGKNISTANSKLTKILEEDLAEKKLKEIEELKALGIDHKCASHLRTMIIYHRLVYNPMIRCVCPGHIKLLHETGESYTITRKFSGVYMRGEEEFVDSGHSRCSLTTQRHPHWKVLNTTLPSGYPQARNAKSTEEKAAYSQLKKQNAEEKKEKTSAANLTRAQKLEAEKEARRKKKQKLEE